MNDRLYRSTQDKVVAGVCGGIAERFDLDPSLVRVGFIVLGVVTAVLPMLIIYAAMAVVVPEAPVGAFGSMGAAPGAATTTAGGASEAAGSDAVAPGAGTVPGSAGLTGSVDPGAAQPRSAHRHRGGDRTGAVVFGALLILVGIAFIVRQYVSINWDQVWPVILIGVGALLVLVSLVGRGDARDKQ